MKNLSYLVIAFMFVGLLATGCSKKSSNKLIGKWKIDSVAGMQKDVQAEIFYEFTKDSMVAFGNVHGEPLDRFAAPYIIKSDDANGIVIEATHPMSGAKGEFKLKLDGGKLKMTDPDNKDFTLTKQ